MSRRARPEYRPWHPPLWDLADASALQSLEAGTADQDAQRRALKWIVEQGAGYYQMSFQPGGEEGRRDSDFAEGRRFVGAQVVKLLRLNLSKLRRKQ